MPLTDEQLRELIENAPPDILYELKRAFVPRLIEPYTKHIPHPTQQLFLSVRDSEVMYGGAAGGGKSDALLMAALQYVDVPGYSALLLRRTWPDLSLPGAIMDRARTWLSDTDAVPKEGGRIWVFPSGARITFGYLQHENDKFRYQGAEFQFVGFDELTQFTESMYLYLFSRIRRPQVSCLSCREGVRLYSGGWKHTNSTNPCNRIAPDLKVVAQYPAAKDGTTIFNVPLRMRSATNPGGIGHTWVRERFIEPLTKEPDAIFVPALLGDNPSLDQQEYRKHLQYLSPVDRERLLSGDWDVSEEGGYFKRHWFKFLTERPVDAKYVRYWDLAATVDGDWTAGCLLGLQPDGRWVVADMVRFRGTPNEVEQRIRQTAEQDGRYVQIRMEQEPGSSGVNVIDHYRRRILVGFDFRADKKSGSKELMAGPPSSAAEAGNISIVLGPWNKDFMDELAMFPNGANDDQVDALSGGFAFLGSRKVRIIA